jgi:hypothetical protein
MSQIWAWHQDIPTDWSSVAMWLWLWHNWWPRRDGRYKQLDIQNRKSSRTAPIVLVRKASLMVHPGGRAFSSGRNQQRAYEILARDLIVGRKIRCWGGGDYQFSTATRSLHHFENWTGQAVVPLERPAQSSAFHPRGNGWSETIAVPQAP